MRSESQVPHNTEWLKAGAGAIPPKPPKRKEGDDIILEMIFDNSALPVGRDPKREDTFGDMGYDLLDFVELCIDVEELLLIEMPDEPQEHFQRIKVEEFLLLIARLKAGLQPTERQQKRKEREAIAAARLETISVPHVTELLDARGDGE